MDAVIVFAIDRLGRNMEDREARKQKERAPKLSDATLKRYFKKCPDLPIKSLWKIMKADGVDISYDWLRKRIKRLKKKEVNKR
ncbi:hypothetical protein [Thermococcus alcaliphilus]|uniref:hypothetical protein n=1 Tax=Thermococcus alcaliphilus TaxID=139207 RepID=UPI0020915515|nr:hypothetical protein [Thermococcus alcaliphilus]MCO6041443.1 hypothetical protein [Thermococcus alcaliphilus]